MYKMKQKNRQKDIVHDAYHRNLAEEIKRVLLECEDLGIFLNKKLASALVAEKSKRGKINEWEIKRIIKNLRGIIK